MSASDGQESDLAAGLKEAYLGDDGNVQWGSLGPDLIAGFVASIWAGVVGVPQSVGAAVGAAAHPVVSEMEAGGTAIQMKLSEIGGLWTGLDFAGPFSLPVNIVFALAVFAVIAWGYQYAR